MHDVMENSMSTGTHGVDPMIKIQTIRECLEKPFMDVKFSQHPQPTFTFHNGLLVINSEFLTDPMPIEELERFPAVKVLKKIQENPGKRIQISKLREITVEEKNLS